MDNYLGEIRLFAGKTAPANWVFCDGRMLNISQYQALYALLGTTYGGDGRTTFGVPDLRGRVPIGTGAGPNLTARNLGNSGGSETVTLETAQMPGHSHTFYATTGPATTIVPQNCVLGNVSAVTVPNPNPGPPPTLPLQIYQDPLTSAVATLAPDAVSLVGSGGPHANVMPSFCVNFIIALIGTFPNPAN